MGGSFAMPENEFELYLSLLSRFLKLNPTQRVEISDELRDHLEQRLEELSARGLSREQAIHTALEEFGDAAELAQHFTRAAQVRRRRLIMRCTYGTAAALAAGLLITAAFWPSTPQGPAPARAVAQDALGGAGGATVPGPGGAGAGIAGVADENQPVETALAKRLRGVSFVEVPLEDVLRKLEEQLEIDILIDRHTLAEEGVALDQPVSFSVTRTQLTGRAALELILEPFQLGFTIRDGLVMVTTQVKAGAALDIQVYNVRDLLTFGAPGGAGFSASAAIDRPSSIAFASVESLIAPLAAAEVSQLGGGGGWGGGAAPGAGGTAGMMPGMTGGGMASGMEGGGTGGMGGFGGGAIHQTNSLAQLISITIDPDSWSDQGGQGSIVQYGDGLLVAKNTQKVHGKIRQLLTMLRESNREQPPGIGGGGGTYYAPATTVPQIPSGDLPPGAALPGVGAPPGN